MKDHGDMKIANRQSTYHPTCQKKFYYSCKRTSTLLIIVCYCRYFALKLDKQKKTKTKLIGNKF